MIINLLVDVLYAYLDPRVLPVGVWRVGQWRWAARGAEAPVAGR